MNTHRPIPVPARRRLQRALQQYGTPVSLVLGTLACLWLWNQHEPVGGLPGEVLAERWELASPIEGRLVELPTSRLALLDVVQEGQLLARIDDRHLQAELAVLRAEVEVTRAEIVATTARSRIDRESDLLDQALTRQRLGVDVQGLRIDVIDRRAQVESLRMALDRALEQESRLRDLAERGAETPNALRIAELERQQVETDLREQEQALVETRRELRQAERRLGELEPPGEPDLDDILAPLQARISVHMAELELLSQRREDLEIRAPSSGTITAIHRQPGEVVSAGDPVVRLTSSQRESVVAWIPQHDPRRPQPGQNARVRPLPVHNASWLATVLQVGDSVELLPEHQRSDPGVPEWGVPVRLSLPEGLPARPGERLDVRF